MDDRIQNKKTVLILLKLKYFTLNFGWATHQKIRFKIAISDR